MIYLHIGPHKTGTTYIQHCLNSAKEDLFNKNYLYTSVGIEPNTPHVAHHDLAHHSKQYLDRDGDGYKSLVDLGRQLKEGGQNVVMSAEGFCTWPVARFLALADILGQEKISTYYTVRDPYDVFSSFWAEEVKQGHTGSLLNKFAKHMSDPFRSRLLNPVVDLAPLIAEDRIDVNVLFYDHAMAENKDIFQEMLEQWLDVEYIDKPKTDPKNERFPIELTEFLRLLTSRKAQGKPHIGSSLRLLFTRGTTSEFRQEVVDAVNKYGSASRRRLTIKRQGMLVRGLEKRIRESLAVVPNVAIPEGPLFSSESSVWHYYDGLSLSQVPEIRELLDQVWETLGLDDEQSI